ncbi:MAG: SDR family NAD(P)-dependent oxidoreductase [Bacteroidetes bacterium]|nr:SDR family NAD(P)-dependent oxidoreductase [Bacteroidota bacterium]
MALNINDLMGSFTGKVILITGASSGIGKALALQMAGKEVQLILASRRLNELKVVQDACHQKEPAVLLLPLTSPLPGLLLILQLLLEVSLKRLMF